MSLLDKILDKSLDKGKDLASDPAWVEKAVASGKKQAGQLGDLKPIADAALDELLANKDKIARVSGAAFVGIVSHLALGKDEDAKLLYLRSGKASFDELMGALDKASDATRAAKKAHDEAWDEVKSVALSILKMAGQIAIPLLLAAI